MRKSAHHYVAGVAVGVSVLVVVVAVTVVAAHRQPALLPEPLCDKRLNAEFTPNLIGSRK